MGREFAANVISLRLAPTDMELNDNVCTQHLYWVNNDSGNES